jgi:hypothetical protein
MRTGLQRLYLLVVETEEQDVRLKPLEKLRPIQDWRGDSGIACGRGGRVLLHDGKRPNQGSSTDRPPTGGT